MQKEEEIVRAPNDHEIMEAQIIVRQLDDCGDNRSKKIRFMSWILRNNNLDRDDLRLENQQLRLKLKNLPSKITRSLSRTDKTEPCEGSRPGSSPGETAKIT